MNNLIILLASGMVEFILILLVFRLGKRWLYLTITINLILIATFGAKLIPIFGVTTNAGNIFYAAIFFATYLQIEGYGSDTAYKSVWTGFLSVSFFVILTQFVLAFHGSSENRAVDEAIDELFKIVPRIALASVIGYIISQYFNIWLYSALRHKMNNKRLWLRNIASLIPAQLLDSILFFSIAFLDVVPTNILWQTMIAGYLIKVGMGVLGTPFLYFGRFLKPE